MTVATSSAKDTKSAATARQVRGGFGLIHELQHPAALGDWNQKQERRAT